MRQNHKGKNNPCYWHGKSHHRLYSIWHNMRCRVFNPNTHDYHLYGGRGITICSAWDYFVNFYKWALLTDYSYNLSLERIDADRGYSPDNCMWATPLQQSQHRRKGRNNTLGWIGVSKQTEGATFQARASNHGKAVYLENFTNAIDAAKARDAYVKAHYENPVLNFPDD